MPYSSVFLSCNLCFTTVLFTATCLNAVWIVMCCVILGLLKFCTFGFMLIWTLIDILLIALQVWYGMICHILLLLIFTWIQLDSFVFCFNILTGEYWSSITRLILMLYITSLYGGGRLGAYLLSLLVVIENGDKTTFHVLLTDCVNSL